MRIINNNIINDENNIISDDDIITNDENNSYRINCSSLLLMLFHLIGLANKNELDNATLEDQKKRLGTV